MVDNFLFLKKLIQIRLNYARVALPKLKKFAETILKKKKDFEKTFQKFITSIVQQFLMRQK